MTGNNRLAIIVTIAWIVIFVLLLMSSFPAEDRIPQSDEVTLTMQASPTDPALTP